MNKATGLLLIAVGLIVMIWGAYGFKTREKIIDLGPIEATKETSHSIPYAPILGGAALVGGIVILVAGSRATN